MARKTKTVAARRKRAKPRPKASESSFRVLADNTPVLIWMSGPDPPRGYFNKSWLEFTGRTLDQEIGDGWIEGVHREDYPRCLENYSRAFRTRRSFTMEYRLRRADGEYRWILDTGQPRFSANDQFAGYIGSCIDITDRKQAEINACEIQLRFETLAYVAPVGIFENDADGQCVYINQRAAEICGIPPEEALGEQWAGALHPEDRDRVLSEWHASVKEKRPYQSEFRFQRSSGKVTWVYGQAVPRCGHDREVTGYVGTLTDITELKEANEKLQASEERFQIVSRATMDVVWDWNLSTNEVWWNDAAQSVFGYSASQIDAEWWFARVHPEDSKNIGLGVHAAIDSGEPSWSGEYRFRCADGSYAHVFDRGYILHDQQGKAIRMIGSMVDITKRKQAEEAVRQSEERLRQLTDHIQEVFWMTDPARQRIIYVSPAYETIWGRTRESAYASPMSWADSIHPDDRDRILNVAVKQTVRDYDEEYRIIRSDGSVRWIRDRAFPVKDEMGKVYRLAGIAEDITELKRTEEELRLHYDELKTLHEISELFLSQTDVKSILGGLLQKILRLREFDIGGVQLLDSQGQVLADAYVGYDDPQNLEGVRGHSRLRPEAALAPGVLHSRISVIVDDVQAGKGLRTFKKENVRSAIVVPVYSGDEALGIMALGSRTLRRFKPEIVHFLEILGNHMGIAAQKARLYEQLQDRLSDLEQASRVKSEFLSVMSHELRTPLNVIAGYTTLIQDEVFGEINPEQREALRKLERHSHSLLGMISMIMEATKIESGALILHRQTFDLGEFLDDFKSTYDLPLDKELRLIWDCPADLPAIKSDRIKLKHILQNLINNAIKFTDKGTVTLSVRTMQTFQVSGDAKQVEFRVADTGVGIAKENIPIIFDMFRQVDSSETRPYSGVGLGLYIVKKFTDLLKGTVEVDSELGKGSTFIVRIPGS